jgi:hypothetical protein
MGKTLVKLLCFGGPFLIHEVRGLFCIGGLLVPFTFMGASFFYWRSFLIPCIFKGDSFFIRCLFLASCVFMGAPFFIRGRPLHF